MLQDSVVAFVVVCAAEEETFLRRQQRARNTGIGNDLSVLYDGLLRAGGSQCVAIRDFAGNEVTALKDRPDGVEEFPELLARNVMVLAIVIAVLNVVDKPLVDLVRFFASRRSPRRCTNRPGLLS